MKYINAADILPEVLVQEIQKYVNGQIIYIPQKDKKTKWGMNSGAYKFFSERNYEIQEAFIKGEKIENLARQYGLSYNTVRNIVYQKENNHRL